MSTLAKPVFEGPELPERPAYDPYNLHPADREARLYDDMSDGIDWDEIIATTQDDWVARRFAFRSSDYPTHEAAMAAMKSRIESIAKEVEHESAPVIDAYGMFSVA